VNVATPEAMDAATPGAMDAATTTETAPNADTPAAVDLVTTTDGGAPDSASAPADGATGPANLARYVGVWTYLFGSEKLQCPGRPETMGSLMGATLTMKMGTAGADLEMASPTCAVRFAISGDVATALPGQTCMSSMGTATLAYAVDSFTFTLEGPSAKEASTWTVTFTDAQNNRRCTLVTSGNLDRGS
jgi:hypothetical protein